MVMRRSEFNPGDKVVCCNDMSALCSSAAVVVKSDDQGVLFCWLDGGRTVVEYPWGEVDELQFRLLGRHVHRQEEQLIQHIGW